MTTDAQIFGSGKLRLNDGTLAIETWRCREPSVVASAERARKAGIQLSTWLENCLRVGAAASLMASNGNELAHAQLSLESLASGVDRSVGEALTRLTATVDGAIDPHDGAIAQAVQAGITRLAFGIDGMLSGPQAQVPERINAAVASAGAGMLAEIQRVLAAQQSAVTEAVRSDRAVLTEAVQQAVQGQQSAILSALADLRATVASREETDAVRSRLTAAGSVYELDVVELLGQIAQDAGDGGATACGATPSATGNKAGDATIDLASGGRIVIEAKKRQQPLSTDAWRRELQSARTNRGADVGIGITTPDAMPTRGRALVVIGQDLVVAYDANSFGYGRDLLAGAYLLARLQVAIHRSPEESADIKAAVRDVELVVAEIERLSGVQRQAGQIASSAQRLLDVVGDVRNSLATHAGSALSRLRASSTGGNVTSA